MKKLSIIKTNPDWLEATWSDEEQVVWCESFSGHKEHIEMLRARGVEFNTSLDEYEEDIQKCIDAYVYPTEEEINKELIANQVQEALNYLAKTDHKDLPRYKPKDDENLEEIYAKRDEAREFVRLNK